MAGTDQEIRRELGVEREQLVEAVGTLRAKVGEATDIRGKLRAKLPVAAAGVVGLGGAAAAVRVLGRLLSRRGRG
jgi:hypothetical protein